MPLKCKLCSGTGDNKSGVRMEVNDAICPRCGGYGTVPDSTTNNTSEVNDEDREYIKNNREII